MMNDEGNQDIAIPGDVEIDVKDLRKTEKYKPLRDGIA